MPIRIGGESNPAEIYVGTESIGEVYVGTELVWQKGGVTLPVYSPVLSYTGGNISSAATSVSSSLLTVTPELPASPSYGGLTFSDNTATNDVSSLSSDGFVTQSNTPNTPTQNNDCTPSGTANDQVADGHSYTWNGSGTTTITSTNNGYTDYDCDVTSGTPTSNKTLTFTVNGNIPAGYQNAGDPIGQLSVNATQLGDQPDAAANCTVPGLGSVAPGTQNSQGSPFTQTGPTTSGTYTCSSNQEGTGTFTDFTISMTETALTEGETVTYSVSNLITTFNNPTNLSYSWTFGGTSTHSPSSSTAASPTVTTSADGTLTASVTVSFAGAEGSTFSFTKAANTITVSDPIFTPFATWGGSTFTASGGTIGTGLYSTNMESPSASIGSNLGNNGSATAVAGSSSTSGGGTTTTYDGVCDGLSPATNQVFAGHGYTQTGTEDGTTVVAPTVTSTPYTYSSTGPTTKPARTVTVTVTGTVPTGFQNAGGSTSATMDVTQAGHTGSAAPTSASAPCGTVSSGTGCTHQTSSGGSSTPVTQVCSESATGNGTFTFGVTDPADGTVGDSFAYSIAPGSFQTTHASGGSGVSYSWTFSGAGVSPTSSSSGSGSVTTSAAGTLTISCTASFAGDGGSTFSHTASTTVDVATNTDCRSTTSGSPPYPSGAPFPIYYNNFGFGGIAIIEQHTTATEPCPNFVGASNVARFNFGALSDVGSVAPAAGFNTAAAGVAGCIDHNTLTSGVRVSDGTGPGNYDSTTHPNTNYTTGSTCTN